MQFEPYHYWKGHETGDLAKSDPGIILSFGWLIAFGVSQVLSILAFVAIKSAMAGEEALDPSLMTNHGVIVSSLISVLVILLLRVRYLTKRVAFDFSAKHLKVGLALFAFMIVVSGIYQTIVISGKNMQPEMQLFFDVMNANPSGFILVTLTVCVITPILEEILFRGQIQTAIDRKLSRKSVKNAHIWSMGITALIFAMIHFQVYAIPILLMAGLILSFIRWKTQSLAWPIIFHISMNLLSTLSVYFFPNS